MDFRVEITDPTIADLAGIVSYIAQDNPEAATAVGNNLLDAALSLAQTPHKGSPYRHIANVRKLTVRPFKIFYRVNERRNIVEVLRFWHSARREAQALNLRHHKPLMIHPDLEVGVRSFAVLRADERELRDFARANLAHFKAPHSVTFVNELPKTATGKIQKYILRAQTTALAPQ